MIEIINSVLETRSVSNGMYKIVLEIPKKEYEIVYDQYTDEIAEEFLTYYLKNRTDDARPENIKIQHDKNSHIVRIMANLNYLYNDHTAHTDNGENYF